MTHLKRKDKFVVLLYHKCAAFVIYGIGCGSFAKQKEQIVPISRNNSRLWLLFLLFALCGCSPFHSEEQPNRFAQTAYSEILNGDFARVNNITEEERISLENMFSIANDKDAPDHWEYVLVDLDKDETPELFMRIKNHIENTGIFHATEDKVELWVWDSVEQTSYYEPLSDGRLRYRYQDYFALVTFDSQRTQTFQQIEHPEEFDQLLITQWSGFWESPDCP